MNNINYSDLEIIASGNYTMRELSLMLEIDKNELKNIIKKYNIVYNTRGYIKWTNRDDKLIYDMRKDGHTNTEIARELGVSPSKVNQRTITIGIAKTMEELAWSKEEDRNLIFMRKMGNPYKDISLILDRGRFACAKRYNKLKKEGKV